MVTEIALRFPELKKATDIEYEEDDLEDITSIRNYS
jgi:hypothetical protein